MPQIYNFSHSMDFRVSVETAFKYLTDVDAIVSMAPASLNVNVKKAELPLRPGSKILFSARPKFSPFELSWLFEVSDFVPNKLFTDVLLKGPVKRWVHRQEFESLGASKCRVIDSVEFSHPTGLLGTLISPSTIESKLGDVFLSREKTVRQVLERKRPAK